MARVTVPYAGHRWHEDTGTPHAWGSSRHTPGRRREGAGPSRASTWCIFLCRQPWISQIIFYQWACFDPVWDKDRVLDLINHFATAFLLAELKGDAEAADALAPENVAISGHPV